MPESLSFQIDASPPVKVIATSPAPAAIPQQSNGAKFKPFLRQLAQLDASWRCEYHLAPLHLDEKPLQELPVTQQRALVPYVYLNCAATHREGTLEQWASRIFGLKVHALNRYHTVQSYLANVVSIFRQFQLPESLLSSKWAHLSPLESAFADVSFALALHPRGLLLEGSVSDEYLLWNVILNADVPIVWQGCTELPARKTGARIFNISSLKTVTTATQFRGSEKTSRSSIRAVEHHDNASPLQDMIAVRLQSVTTKLY